MPRDKFIVFPFGLNDDVNKFTKIPSPVNYDYVLSIGRSNRDFDFLLDLWSQPELSKHNLIVIADMWQPKKALPKNVIHYDNLNGESSMPFFANAKATIIPISNPVMCSGDTVLLRSMMMSQPLIVTAPSAIADTYIEDNKDGLLIGKDTKEAKRIAELLENKEQMAHLSTNARKKYISKYTLKAIGKNFGLLLTKL